jgi:hypothetical protein
MMLLALLVLMFVAGISAVGIVHQTTWVLTGPDPFLGRRDGRVVIFRLVAVNRLKQIAIAADDYREDNKTYPPGTIFDARGNALHGWQTLLLPYIEQDALYRAINLKLPWRHPANAMPFRQEVLPYLHPAGQIDRDEAGYALSHYSANVRVMGGGKPLTRESITDGTSNTILAGEVGTYFRPWGYPANWRDPARGIHTGPDSFGTPIGNSESTQFVMADGSVRSIRNDVSPAILRALSTPAGGETIPAGDW